MRIVDIGVSEVIARFWSKFFPNCVGKHFGVPGFAAKDNRVTFAVHGIELLPSRWFSVLIIVPGGQYLPAPLSACCPATNGFST